VRSTVAAIVFDLDDTLYLERDFVRSGFHAVDSYIADLHLTPGFFDGAWTLFQAGRRGDIFDRVLRSLEIPTNADFIRDLVGIYRNHKPSIQLAPDAEEALTASCRSHPMALLTDGFRRTQERKVEALGLVERLRPIVYTDSFGRAMWKPHPRGFTAIQDRLGLQPHQLAYVADNPLKDFVTPRRLGWRTIRVRRPEGQYAHLCVERAKEADCTITSLGELRKCSVLKSSR
jgi:putative hydrolase of the HAD superfamily